MELKQQLEFKDFLISTLTAYINDIGTEKDTVDSYLSLFKSFQDYKLKVTREDLKKLLSDLQNVLLIDNENYYRKSAGELLLVIIKFRSTIEFIIDRWNDYYLSIIYNLKNNPYQIDEIKSNKNSFIFYLHFDNDNDEFSDAVEIISNRDLFVGDFLDFSDHKIFENLDYVYKTPLFKIIKRQYSVAFGKMNLHLAPFKE